MSHLSPENSRWLIPFALLSCRSTGVDNDAGPAPVLQATTTATAPAPVASPASAPAASGADAGASPSCEATAAKDALADALLERFVFRQISVGMITLPRRFTWILSRAPARVRLQLICQVGISPYAGEKGNRVNGTEIDESVWGPPRLTVYAGARTSETPLSLRLDVVAGSTGDDGCARPPARLRLSCQRGSVPALTAGAVLEPWWPPGGNEAKGRWRPPGVQQVGALICEVAKEEDDGQLLKAAFSGLWPSWPLVFAPRRGESAGVEWAFENSDMVVQEGAYRFLPAPRE